MEYAFTRGSWAIGNPIEIVANQDKYKMTLIKLPWHEIANIQLEKEFRMKGMKTLYVFISSIHVLFIYFYFFVLNIKMK